MANPMNKWKLDFGNSRAISRLHDTTMNPPGFNQSICQSSQHSEHAGANPQNQQHLMTKRAWDLALQPIKSVPMNMIMMYMAGNTISIFPIMMVVMMAWRPMRAIMTIGQAFKSIESEYSGSLILHKLIFSLGNMAAIALAVYKCHSMGLLPNHASDWLDFVPPAERMQYVLFGDTFV
ncbi:unnamed protein product [Bursaphelenchus okinawaensis]|uniref:ER membrane protein complex subunit 4 n=1 Tax=Bursaphelenchus okinawaensis TaxID=465554 RepID=A0A811LPX6_9BILA|nr:unnamed protein product [Bursaphelenchus okinawaensis]CAG9126725.1 unnamed protein product [Bursaphelenchus okinawaensis]